MERKRTILITGASSGIGRALVSELAKEPCRILAHYNAADPSAILEESGEAEIHRLKADLTSEDAVRKLIEQIGDLCEYPDAFVHLPARKLMFERFAEARWDAVSRDMRLQAASAFWIAQAFLPIMAKKKVSGRVVFMLSSVTLGMPPKNLPGYTLSKYALFGLMRALAAEYAGTRIRINAVSPSMVETDLLSETPAKLVEIAAVKHPMGRNAQPRDIIPTILFLLSEGTDYLTGVNLPVTGGQVA